MIALKPGQGSPRAMVDVRRAQLTASIRTFSHDGSDDY